VNWDLNHHPGDPLFRVRNLSMIGMPTSRGTPGDSCQCSPPRVIAIRDDPPPMRVRDHDHPMAVATLPATLARTTTALAAATIAQTGRRRFTWQVLSM
jgi:hypothetical protein